MKINLKVRFRNPAWWVQVFISIVTPILTYMGIRAEDITTWQVVGDMFLEAVRNPYLLGLIVVNIWNTLNDPTTPTFSDSERAMSYVRPSVIEEFEDYLDE